MAQAGHGTKNRRVSPARRASAGTLQHLQLRFLSRPPTISFNIALPRGLCTAGRWRFHAISAVCHSTCIPRAPLVRSDPSTLPAALAFRPCARSAAAMRALLARFSPLACPCTLAAWHIAAGITPAHRKHPPHGPLRLVDRHAAAMPPPPPHCASRRLRGCALALPLGSFCLCFSVCPLTAAPPTARPPCPAQRWAISTRTERDYSSLHVPNGPHSRAPGLSGLSSNSACQWHLSNSTGTGMAACSLLGGDLRP